MHQSQFYPQVAAIMRLIGTAMINTLLAASLSAADEPLSAEANAPPGHEVLLHDRKGVYFVAKPLKERYDQLLARLQALKSQIEAENIPGAEALEELRQIQTQLADLRKEIEANKVLVSPVQVHTQMETVSFDLGPEQLLVVTADSVRVEGWDGQQVKCELEKTVLTVADQPADEHLAGIRVVHRHGMATDLVGRTDNEIEADEQKYLASPDGRKLTAPQLAARRKLVGEIAAGFSAYREFQGREIDTLHIDGLTYEEGNRQLSIRARSAGGGGSFGSQWQRHASLTVFVPACKAVALRGCFAALDVKGVHADLLATGQGSRDRDYNGTFRISDVRGSLTVYQVPVQAVEDVQGNVTLTVTEEFANTGTQHEQGWRTAYAPPPLACSCKNIAGDLSASFGRVELTLENASGTLNVRNDFGNTTFAARQPLSPAAHRIISESGRIEITLARPVAAALPVLAITSHGKVSTNASQDLLEDTHFTTTTLELGGRYDWRGVVSKTGPDDPAAFLSKFERPGKAWLNQDRSDGLDLISRGGSIVVKIDE